jgi:hypothetical protein
MNDVQFFVNSSFYQIIINVFVLIFFNQSAAEIEFHNFYLANQNPENT